MQIPSPSELTVIGIRDTDSAARLLSDMAGGGVTDDDLAPLWRLLPDALRQSPDPDRSVAGLTRWFANVTAPTLYLKHLLIHPVALHLLCLLTGSSQYFADLLSRNPEYFDILADPGVRGGTKSRGRMRAEASALLGACIRPELKRDVLRRWKAREMLRIGARDLLGLAEMPATAREFSNLADVCVQEALNIAWLERGPADGEAAMPFAVIAMGKLGGQELNYSSDIDLVFVHGDSLPSEVILHDGRRSEAVRCLQRVAEAIVSILSDDTSSGHVFRVDMRLRPEGRFGPLTRSLASCAVYYESWGEPWERQALLKARPIAGDSELCAEFLRVITPFVYRHAVSRSFLEAVRENKRKIELKCEFEGLSERNVKTGRGGIRDVEFIVQALQLEFGGSWPHLRTTNTLSAIQRLRHAGFLSDAQAQSLSGDYVYLRNLEHRLQLLHGFQTQVLPAPEDTIELEKLARRMGFDDRAGFEAETEVVRSRVRRHLEELFYSPLGNSDGQAEGIPGAHVTRLLEEIRNPDDVSVLSAFLGDLGWRRPELAARSMSKAMFGDEFGAMPPDTVPAFRVAAAEMVRAASESADPDMALEGMEALAYAVPNRAHLYQTMGQDRDLTERLTRLAGFSPYLMARLARHQEWMESVLVPGDDLDVDADGLISRLQTCASRPAAAMLIASYHQRQVLRIAALEAWAHVPAAETCKRLSAVADSIINGLAYIAEREVGNGHERWSSDGPVLSVVALGKLGGRETGYASDWDVMLFAASRSGSNTDQVDATRTAESLLSLCSDLSVHGSTATLDLRLRPWGKKGSLVQTARGLAEYHNTDAETWERHLAVKARLIRGAEYGRRATRMLSCVSFRRGLTAAEDARVQAMKGRIEAERLGRGDELRDLKLGNGGLLDIEWLVQRLQLLFGRQYPTLRVTSTLHALDEIRKVNLLPGEECDVLASSYELLTRVRNCMWLRRGSPEDLLPDGDDELDVLSRMAGFRGVSARFGARALRSHAEGAMSESRRIFIERFYADPSTFSVGG